LAGIFTQSFDFELESTRHYYLYVVKGTAQISGQKVSEGDGMSYEQESVIEITDPQEVEIILFDLR